MTALRNRATRRHRDAPATVAPDVAAVIDEREFDEAGRDPRLIEFARRADEQYRAAEREGRIEY